MAFVRKVALLSSPVVASFGWSHWAKLQREVPPESTAFPVGSTDDIIAESLKSGDIVLFTKNWRIQSPSVAALTYLKRQLYGCRFDHCGIIVADRFGVPHVAEVTGQGILMRPYDTRISWSKSLEVAVVPVGLSSPPEEARVKLERYVKAQTPERTLKEQKPFDSFLYEALALYKLYRCRQDKGPEFMGPAMLASRQAAFVAEGLGKLGVIDIEKLQKGDKELHPALLTTNHLLEKKLPLEGGLEYGPERLIRRANKYAV
ncbi:unnamed protein product [Chrysoparadoxa australica]